MKAEVRDEWKLVPMRHDKTLIIYTKGPVQDADENLQGCCAYREYVFQGKEMFVMEDVCKETESECYCGHRERDEG